MPSRSRTAMVVAIAGLLSIVHAIAQTPPAATIRCSQCAVAGQKPDTAPINLSKLAVVDQLRPAVFEGHAIREELVGRVLSLAPFQIETLDVRIGFVDRRGAPLGPPDDDAACSMQIVEAVDRASLPLVTRLRLNDVITAQIVMHVGSNRPEDVLGARPVLADVRRAASPVSYLHTPASAGCSNRSGRLLEYRGPSYDSVIVYNDGMIDYRDTLQRHFNRERLSVQEIAELLRAFADAGFDALPADVNEPQRGPMPGITLVAARYQDVWLAGNEARLDPLVTRLKGVVARATSRTSFLLKAGRSQKLTIELWPYARIAKLDGYMAARNTSRRRRESGETPPGGPWDQRVPDEFLDRLPGVPQMPNRPLDPNRFLYFSEDGALYRVMHNPNCRGTKEDWWCTSFYTLSVEKIETIEFRLQDQARRTWLLTRGGSQARTVGDLDPSRLADYNIDLGGGADVYRWTSDMFTTLADVPPGGATVPADEYERHKALYRAILGRLEGGVNLIENGVVFEHVRICQIESGAVDCPDR